MSIVGDLVHSSYIASPSLYNTSGSKAIELRNFKFVDLERVLDFILQLIHKRVDYNVFEALMTTSSAGYSQIISYASDFLTLR